MQPEINNNWSVIRQYSRLKSMQEEETGGVILFREIEKEETVDSSLSREEAFTKAARLDAMNMFPGVRYIFR